MKRSNQLKFGDWSALDAYLREINQIPMLGETELQETGVRAANGELAAVRLKFIASLMTGCEQLPSDSRACVAEYSLGQSGQHVEF